MANLCIKTPSSAIQVLIFQLLVLRPRPTDGPDYCDYLKLDVVVLELEVEGKLQPP